MLMFTPNMTSRAAVGDAATSKLKCPDNRPTKPVKGGGPVGERPAGGVGEHKGTRDRNVLRERWGIGKRKAKRGGISTAVYVALWLA